MLVAAHNNDLRARLSRAWPLRSSAGAELGPRRLDDQEPAQEYTVVAADFHELADRLGA